jgi:hypothetical protein
VSELPPIEPPPAPPSPPLPYQGLPWEAPNAGLGSLFPTAGQFITSPVRAYTKMSLTADLVRPIAYFVAFVLLGAVVSQFWSVLFWDQIMGFVKAFVPPQFQSFIQRPSLVTITFGVVIAPLISLIVLFIWSGILHLILALLGGAAGGFATTLRAVCYSRTADVGSVVPLLGGLVTFVWTRVLEIIGLSQAHRTERWKAALAVVIPLALCCVCLVGGIFAFGAAIFQAIQQMK